MWIEVDVPAAYQFALTEIDGLDSLRSFDSLIFAGNENLVAIDGLIGLAERTGPPVAGGPALKVSFAVNPSLPIDDIQQLWDQHMKDGPTLFTCSNLGEAQDCGRLCVPVGR
jgi:hypothetical protein